jgi:predicted permease
VVTLGLGVGVLTALFAVVQAVLLRPIATDQNRVVRVWKNDVAHGMDRHSLSYDEFLTWRDRARTFVSLAAINYADSSTSVITVGDQPAVVSLTPVSAGFFTVLHGGPPAQGRWIEAADEARGSELVAVVSEKFWRRALAADPRAVGRRLTWAGTDRTVLIVGIAPRDLVYPLGTDMWVPIASFFAGPGSFHFDITDRRLSQFELVGRLARGVTVEEARAELAVLARQSIAQYPADYKPMPIVATPLLETVVGSTRPLLMFLLAAAGLVFVIAGVNVSALLLMRAAERRSELTVRVALGATPARLISQTIGESVLLGCSSTLLGVLVARGCLIGLRVLGPDNLPHLDEVTLNIEAVVFCLLSIIAWVILLGTAPLWGQWRQQRVGFRHDEASVRVASRTRSLRVFTTIEIAAAVFVAIGAGLLIRSFVRLQRVDRGFDASHLTVVNVLLPESRYPDSSSRLAFYEQLLGRVDALPGVSSASPVHMEPGSGSVGLSAAMTFQGQSPAEAANNPWATWEPVTPSYFRTLGIPILRGRAFDTTDGRTGPPTAIVSEGVARRYWPGADPIGKRLRLGADFPWVTVVGVAADMRYRELTRPWLTVYFPAEQFFFFAPESLVVRSPLRLEAIAPALRDAIRAQEPSAAVQSIATMDALLARELSRPRTALGVASLFAALAIGLACVGVYGVMSYDVRRRRRELAIRSAIGASPERLLRDVFSRSLALCAIGLAAGVLAASVSTRFLRTLLFDTEPSDPISFAMAAVVLFVLVLLASYGPARRAAAADPVVVLRSE